MSPMFALLLAAALNPGFAFAHSLAVDGRRPAGSAAERHAQVRVARAFSRAGLRVSFARFRVPGRGRSRDVVGVFDTPARCLRIVMAHADSMPRTPGAVDNASGVGVVVALAPRLRVVRPRCDVWLVATGSEERLYTGQPNHLGASALVRRVRRSGRAGDLRIALALDEVGRGRSFDLRSDAARVRPAWSGRCFARCAGRAARRAGFATTAPATRTTASSSWRGCPRRSWASRTTPAVTCRATARACWSRAPSRWCAGPLSGCCGGGEPRLAADLRRAVPAGEGGRSFSAGAACFCVGGRRVVARTP